MENRFPPHFCRASTITDLSEDLFAPHFCRASKITDSLLLMAPFVPDNKPLNSD